jgi:heavy metal sensor kinase
MTWWRPTRLRSRLTVWHGVMLGGVLVIYIAGVAFFSIWQMRSVVRRLAVEDLETVKGLLYWASDGKVGVREDYHHHSDWKQVQERFLEILSPNGNILYQNEMLAGRKIGGPIFPDEGVGGYSERSEKMSDGTRVILFSREYMLQDRPVIIREAYNEDLIWSQVEGTLLILLLALPLAIAATVYVAYEMAGRALDPIGKMATRASQINSQRLNERLPVENREDELGHLASVFNDMLSRIAQSFDHLERFTSDASHELRTPLAAIRSIGEVALQRDLRPEEYRDVIGSMLEEVNRLTSMVETLLVLSRADAGELPMQVSVWSAKELVEEVSVLLEILIEEKRLKLTISGDKNRCVLADRMYVRQAVMNIFHNAVKFTPAGGAISVSVDFDVTPERNTVLISFADTGPGIPAAHTGLVFERFYRVNEVRSSDTKGSGLGLSITKWAVEANGGAIAVAENPAGGCTFSIRLPASPCPASI